MPQPIYILGTGLSHNGSAVLLKDGKVCVGIEKERLTRKKHDGGNDSAAISYCLEAEGITLADVSLVVQCANFEVPDRDRFQGPRLFEGTTQPPVISISHHLAHAYSAAGTCPFETSAILVIDGCGSPFGQCTDLDPATVLPDDFEALARTQLWCEKDSFYRFDGQRVTALYKDFSPMAAGNGEPSLRMQTTAHSIGGFYSAVSHYVFGNLDDVGKLMGLAPYGKDGACRQPAAFTVDNGRLFVNEDWKTGLDRPAGNYAGFKAHFQYYADIALWAQQQVEEAVAACFRARLKAFPQEQQVSYTGGVALNAVANARLLDEGVLRDLYLEPAAGDNGLALGCAFYGWLETMGKPKVPHDGSTCFGKTYAAAAIAQALAAHPVTTTFERLEEAALLLRVAALLNEGKTVGWFRGPSEFGPRALGHRSILAHPGIPGLGDHINANIKFREDFRPFAPAVLPEYASRYFESGRTSPYMILVDRTKPFCREALSNVTHVNGTARVQTVDRNWNEGFVGLLEQFHRLSGIPVLLNTSFNKKGMPIVEQPEEAIALFAESALDVLVIEEYLVVR
jgi:carbamoyltransferase